MIRAAHVALVALALAALAALPACDNREAFHEPEPTWARMLQQRRGDPFEASSAFDDGMTMRTPPPGTLARDDVSDAPEPPLTRDLLVLGRDRFERVCATCHGMAGDGVSVVAEKMALRRPPNLHDERFRKLSRPQIYAIATHGYGLMPSSASQLDARERWAAAAYVQALQLARRAPVAMLDARARADLGKEAP